MLRFFKAVRPSAGFTTDEPPATKPYTADLFATVRDNGRIIDRVRYVLGGNAIIETDFKLGKIFDDEDIANWTLHVQRWAKDIDLRKGLLSGPWMDVGGLVASRDAAVFDSTGAGIPANEFLKRLQGEEDEEPLCASIRWAVVLDDAAHLAIQLQGLPAGAAVLMGKPSLKRYLFSLIATCLEAFITPLNVVSWQKSQTTVS